MSGKKTVWVVQLYSRHDNIWANWFSSENATEARREYAKIKGGTFRVRLATSVWETVEESPAVAKPRAA